MKPLTAEISRTSVLGQWVAAVLLCGTAASVGAATSSGQFAVTATFVSVVNPILPKSAFCQTTPALAFGALVTVVCATGEVVNIEAPAGAIPGVPIHGGAYRLVLSPTFAPGLPNFYDSFSGYGMASSWQVIQVGDRSYYELLMGW